MASSSNRISIWSAGRNPTASVNGIIRSGKDNRNKTTTEGFRSTSKAGDQPAADNFDGINTAARALIGPSKPNYRARYGGWRDGAEPSATWPARTRPWRRYTAQGGLPIAARGPDRTLPWDSKPDNCVQRHQTLRDVSDADVRRPADKKMPPSAPMRKAAAV